MKNVCGGLEQAYLNRVIIDREAMTMEVSARFCTMPAPAANE